MRCSNKTDTCCQPSRTVWHNHVLPWLHTGPHAMWRGNPVHPNTPCSNQLFISWNMFISHEKCVLLITRIPGVILQWLNSDWSRLWGLGDTWMIPENSLSVISINWPCKCLQGLFAYMIMSVVMVCGCVRNCNYNSRDNEELSFRRFYTFLHREKKPDEPNQCIGSKSIQRSTQRKWKLK